METDDQGRSGEQVEINYHVFSDYFFALNRYKSKTNNFTFLSGYDGTFDTRLERASG